MSKKEETNGMAISPKWTRPDEVMRFHRMKLKKKQLQARMMNRTDESKSAFGDSIRFSGSSSTGSLPIYKPLQEQPEKSKNPFRCKPNKRAKVETPEPLDLEMASSDATLFTLLNMNAATTTQGRGKKETPTNFTSILSQIQHDSTKTEVLKTGESFIPVDWMLKTKLRLTSSEPFPWSGQLRTCEEASGITGFVRCLATDRDAGSLDTSATARFHQRCLVWQHPALPWLQLYPRTAGRVSHTNPIGNDQRMKDALYHDFTESFRSLFQLVRARQCPYFYVCANAFTCLFRAAGVGGYSDIHALLTPTTRGFRQLLKEDDVVFSMPLRRSRDSGFESQEDSAGVGAVDAGGELGEGAEVEEDEEEEDCWLESMGVGQEVIKRLNKKQASMTFDKERSVDRTPESLVLAEGVEAQALFNFLRNCKSIVPATGALAGVTPTLLAPTAFHGATLKPLKVGHSMVRGGSSMFHSVELRGPVLPHVLHELCHLLGETRNEFSAACVNLEPTRPFSLAAQAQAPNGEAAVFSPSKAPAAFGQESLSDCGLSPATLASFCCDDAARVLPVDNIRRNADGTYSW